MVPNTAGEVHSGGTHFCPFCCVGPSNGEYTLLGSAQINGDKKKPPKRIQLADRSGANAVGHIRGKGPNRGDRHKMGKGEIFKKNLIYLEKPL
jgi:hypothetical protein